MNVAYKHLQSPVKIGEFTLLQWFGFFLGVMLALLWGMYLSPFGSYITLITAVYIGGIPVGAAFLAGVSDVNVWLHIKALSRHRRAVGRYVPGPGVTAEGYVVTPDDQDDHGAAAISSAPELELDELWQT